MRIKLEFGPNTIPFSIKNPVQEQVNKMIHTMLGVNNKFHDTFSQYSVSQLFGGVLSNYEINYPDGGVLYISSINEEFIDLIISYIINNPVKIGDMSLQMFSEDEYKLHMNYDIIRVNNLFLKDSDNKIITINDKHYYDVLKTKTLKKLEHNGITSDDLKNFSIEPFHPENARTKKFFMKTGHGAILTSNVMLTIKGNKKTRNTLYNLGIGTSTGCGCGNVTINTRK